MESKYKQVISKNIEKDNLLWSEVIGITESDEKITIAYVGYDYGNMFDVVWVREEDKDDPEVSDKIATIFDSIDKSLDDNDYRDMIPLF